MRRATGWVKRADRAPVNLCGSLNLGDGRRLPVIVTDVSDNGCKVRTNHMLPIGEIVQLNIAGRDSAAASVRWSMLGKAGLRFFEPIAHDDSKLASTCRKFR